MFRAITSPILRSTRLCLQLVVKCTGDAARWQDGRNYRPKHVELIVIINKIFLSLHLVGCLHYCVNDARSHKHQILGLFAIPVDLW